MKTTVSLTIPGSGPPKSDLIVNESGSDEILCSKQPPTTQELFRDLPPGGYVMYSMLILFFVITLSIYIEEVIFILKKFKISMRKKKTIWILAFYPVYSFCGLLGCIVPRSGTLIDMVANLYFGTCLYNFGRLLVSYMGGAERIWRLIGTDRKLHFHTPPVCCCCYCLPPVKLTRSVFFRVSFGILQVAIVRPIIMFFAAVLWTNGSYDPGQMKGGGAYLYITIINLFSTLWAIYCLMLLREAFRPELERDFRITGKVFSLQLALTISSIPNFILSILVTTNVITCGPIFPSEARAEAIYHAILVLVMLPFSILARYFFRRSFDGYGLAGPQPKARLDPTHLQQANPKTEAAVIGLAVENRTADEDDDDEEEEEEEMETVETTLETQSRLYWPAESNV